MISVAIARGWSHFDGPLDVLVALVRRNQYPLGALPIAEITRQYLGYIKIPMDAPMDFIKKRWEKLVFTEDGVDRRRY